MPNKRRKFLKQSTLAGAGLILSPWMISSCSPTGSKDGSDTETATATENAASMFFSISLAEWSLHKAFFAKKITNLDFPVIARKEFDIEAIEYVNQMFKDKAEDTAYLDQLNTIANDNGVKQVLIMVDGEGNLGASDEKERIQAVENHYKWVGAAKRLGCHSIRVNAAGNGTREAVSAAAVDGLGRLSEFAATAGLNVIVENHGGYSSDGSWLAGVMKAVNMDNCGTLPDFGNFCIERSKPETNTPEGWAAVKCLKEYDRYKGVTELMPYAKGVSAKTNDFDVSGNETQTDFRKMLQIVKDAGYRGYIGIEYEGNNLGEYEGISATKALLEKVGAELG